MIDRSKGVIAFGAVGSSSQRPTEFTDEHRNRAWRASLSMVVVRATVLKMHSNSLVKAMGPEPAPPHCQSICWHGGLWSRHAAFVAGGPGHLYPQVLPVGTRGSEPSSRTHRCAVRRSTTAGESLLELVSE